VSALVEFRDLNVSYGTLKALSGVSGEVLPGATGLLGPNGAGKTTLLKTLLGFLVPDSGQMRAFDLDPGAAPLDVRRRIGYMPENDCHVAGMTAAAFVAYAGELSGLPRDEAVSRAHEVLYYVGLGESRYRPVDTYSTGMKQRAKLAQALVHDPDLLLLDEPTNGLDPQGREEMLELIRDVAQKRGISLVLCSHLLRDVERVCERVIVFDRGRVAAAGAIAELTGPRRTAWEVRVKGDLEAFGRALAAEGGEYQPADDGLRVLLPEGAGAERIVRAARAAGVQVRRLKAAGETLEDVFLRALGADH
jgi:ABC-2 type transport system ATP-binding protein